ncbi:MAG TPA: hypothetical protein VJ001_08460 [Rhodocyclaceae bacterium]|nr:hypothetical protein [Rhodocyclaceae bacterium]
MPITRLAEAYLHAYHAGEDPPNGLAFRKALEQAQLDYSPDSLARIDRLLRQMHEKLNPQFDVFIDKQANRNFLYLLCFYIGKVVGRYTLSRVEWYYHEELSGVLPSAEMEGIPDCFGTSIACIFARDGQLGGYFFPLSAMQDILFAGDASRSVLDSADKFMRRAVGVPVLRYSPAGATATSFGTDVPGSIAEGLHRLGMLAGGQATWAFRTALESGLQLEPQFADETPDGQRRIVSMTYGDAIETGRLRLQQPEPDIVGGVLAYDGNINLPKFRTDALIIEAQWHAPAVRVILAVPYRSANCPTGFALHNPRVLECSLDSGYLPVFEAAFFAGLDSVKPSGLWVNRFVDEDSADNLNVRIAEQAATDQSKEQHDPFENIRLDQIDIRQCVESLSASETAYLDVPMPGWVHGDELRSLFRRMPTLLRTGRVVWGYLVQANRLLFERGEHGHPGEVLYDPAGKLGPSALKSVAHRLFELRSQLEALRAGGPLQPDMLRLAEHFESEIARAFALPVPQQISPDGLLVSTTYFERPHLPFGMLVASFFPLLVSDRYPGEVMVLPSRWWPQALLEMWSDLDRATRRADWEAAWAKLALERNEEDEQYRQARLAAIRGYVAHGIEDARIVELTDLGLPGFKPDCMPPPLEWEWELEGDLSSLAEQYTNDVERARARGQPLIVERARLAFATRYIAQMIGLHRLMLCRQRGCDPEHFRIWADEIQYVALGLVVGCEQSALRMARILCAAWQHPQVYIDFVRPEVRAIFIVLAHHLDVSLPPLTAVKETPKLNALLAEDCWLRADAATLAPLIEAACEEHTEHAPDGPFRGLPIALVLMFKLRAQHGLENPAISHKILASPLGAWAKSATFDAALDPLLFSALARLSAHAYDEDAIEAAVIRRETLAVPIELGRPARGGEGGKRSAKASHRPMVDAKQDEPGFALGAFIGLVVCLLLIAGCLKLMFAFNIRGALLALIAGAAALLAFFALAYAVTMFGSLRKWLQAKRLR